VATQAARRPDALAVAAPDARLTYAQLEAQAQLLAVRLASLHVRVETRVGLLLPRSAALVTAALGILKAGAAYVALDPANPLERLRFMLRDSGADVVVTTSAIASQLAHPGTVVTFDAAAPELDGEVPVGVPEAAEGGTLAYVVYTSGSTGLPKGVLVEHASLANLASWHRAAFALNDSDRGTQIASPGFDAVVWEIWPLLTAGASVHVPVEQLRTDPPALRDWLVEQRITTTFLPTALAEAMLVLRWPTDTSLRHMLTGGDALHRYPPAHLPFTLVNNYGPAEATVVATSGMVAARGADASQAGTTPSIGAAITGVTLHVVDDALRPVAAGEVGELLVGGAGVARGYLNRPDLTTERFIADPIGGGRVYRTGDLVRAGDDGRLEFVGRSDEQVQIAGRRIELGEIASTLAGHPSVRLAAVIAVGASDATKRLLGFVVPADGVRPDTPTLRAHLATTLPDYMVPSDIVCLDALPMTASDKVDRSALAALGQNALPEAGAAPRNELEEVLVEIIAGLLEVPTVGVDQNFFLLGGHSLLGAQLIARIDARFGVELPLRDVFEKPTVAEMAVEIERLLVADLESMTDEEAERLAMVAPAGGGGL
jgi:amino acid adenylation domain-containing protein